MNYIETLICATIGAYAAFTVIKAAYEVLEKLQSITSII